MQLLPFRGIGAQYFLRMGDAIGRLVPPVPIFRLRTILHLSIVLFSLLIYEPLFAAEFDFLHNHPGKFIATVSSNSTLKKTEAAEFKRNLERLRDLLAKQPVFTPPVGVEVIGYFRPNDDQPKTKNIPIPGFGYLRFHFFHQNRKTGKPVYICCTTDEIHISINDPGVGFERFGGSNFLTKAMYEPLKVGEIAGFPIYRTRGGTETIVLSRSKVPLFLPVTREEYVAAELKRWQREAADAPAVDTITPQIVQNHQEALEAMPAEERKLQARHYSWDPMQPALAPLGSGDGEPLVRVNPAWFDHNLPRSAFQLITVTFSYSGNMNHDAPGPAEHGDIAPYRVWQSLHTSNWKEISGALTEK